MATASSPALTFPAATSAQVGNDATWISGWTASTGGTRLFKRQISNNPDALTEGQPYQLAAGQIVLTIPNGQFDAPLALRGVVGCVSGGIWIQLHSGDPGNANANALTIPRVQAAAANWTTAQ